MNRLTSVTSASGNESYNFDDVGNRLSSHKSASYGYQPFNKVISTATANYVYDANGNMVSKAEGMNFWRYGFDYENRLVSASTRKQTIRYRYDALGRRVQRFTVGGKENTKFIYDGQDVLVDDNSGTLTKYINGAGIDNKLRSQTGSTVNYFLSDHLGSTNGLTDASGNLTASTGYDAFGNATNANFPSRYQFTGREYDNFTGLHYYRARFYDGNLGRFVSEDPIGFAGGDVNLYGYVRNKPLNFYDPFGLDEHAMMERLKNPQPTNRSAGEMLDELQMQLGLVGMTPVVGEPFDALDGAISLGRGNYGDAALSGSSMIPFFGWGAGVTKICRRVSKYVDLTDFRRTHILNRHKAGTGISGKTEFPASWSDDKLIHNVSDVATDPNAIKGVDNFGNWNQPYVIGNRDGVDIRVDFYPSNSIHSGKISTAYPINVPPNP